MGKGTTEIASLERRGRNIGCDLTDMTHKHWNKNKVDVTNVKQKQLDSWQQNKKHCIHYTANRETNRHGCNQQIQRTTNTNDATTKWGIRQFFECPQSSFLSLLCHSLTVLLGDVHSVVLTNIFFPIGKHRKQRNAKISRNLSNVYQQNDAGREKRWYRHWNPNSLITKMQLPHQKLTKYQSRAFQERKKQLLPPVYQSPDWLTNWVIDWLID